MLALIPTSRNIAPNILCLLQDASGSPHSLGSPHSPIGWGATGKSGFRFTALSPGRGWGSACHPALRTPTAASQPHRLALPGTPGSHASTHQPDLGTDSPRRRNLRSYLTASDPHKHGPPPPKADPAPPSHIPSLEGSGSGPPQTFALPFPTPGFWGPFPALPCGEAGAAPPPAAQLQPIHRLQLPGGGCAPLFSKLVGGIPLRFPPFPACLIFS